MKYKILLILFAIALITSVLLSFADSSSICNVNGSCSKVAGSEYSKLVGVNNSYFGIIIFLFLTILTFSEIRKPRKIKRFVINTGVVIGTPVALFFLYLQQFVLKEYCKYCLIIDISILVALLIIVYSWKRKKRIFN